MDDQRVGRIVRALRRRRGWRQVDVAAAAECSQNLVSRLERGHIDGLSLRLIRRILAALDALILIELQWQGAAIDRLLDEDHAALVGVIAKRLRELGWLVEVEVTYSHFGERGSIDILAFWPTSGVVLVIEVKTDLPSAEATLRKLDEKVRLAPVISLQRFKWNVSAVARLVVFPDVSTLRRRVARHTNIFGTALPERSIAVRRWIAAPTTTPLSGLWFLSARDAQVAIQRRGGRHRVRRPRESPTSHEIAA